MKPIPIINMFYNIQWICISVWSTSSFQSSRSQSIMGDNRVGKETNLATSNGDVTNQDGANNSSKLSVSGYKPLIFRVLFFVLDYIFMKIDGSFTKLILYRNENWLCLKVNLSLWKRNYRIFFIAYLNPLHFDYYRIIRLMTHDGIMQHGYFLPTISTIFRDNLLL